MAQEHHLRFHAPHLHLAGAFGSGGFAAFAETTARFFGTPQYLISQTFVVICWIALNAIGVTSFDVYPFILLNLAFSLQAAYAAPLILLAETRQAERERVWSDADARHREELSRNTLTLLQQNTELLQQNTDLTKQVRELTEQVRSLTTEIHGRIVRAG